MAVSALNRTLDQELLALERGASLECPVCGEFVLHVLNGLRCPECGSTVSRTGEPAGGQLQFTLQAG